MANANEKDLILEKLDLILEILENHEVLLEDIAEKIADLEKPCGNGFEYEQ